MSEAELLEAGFLNHITSHVSSRSGEAARWLAGRLHLHPGEALPPAIPLSAWECHRGGPGITSG
jgi:hypothetical protein